jgi:hypothetical protein
VHEPTKWPILDNNAPSQGDPDEIGREAISPGFDETIVHAAQILPSESSAPVIENNIAENEILEHEM